ncbi:MAG TPA: energy-coupling factor transporter transmembrane component T [Gaiellales bacterium]|jgi:energy-coupling factor transport system permease protein
MRPLPAALVCAAPLLIAVAAWNPLWLAAATIGAGLLLLAAPPPRRLYAVTAISSGVIVFALNPFVSVQGLTVLWQGPHIPILDTQVTAEELAFGAGAGMRVAASALAVAAFVRLADADLLLRAVARIAPRSAMIAALATRMVPALERDAAGMVTAARTRAARMSSPRTAAGLLGPLLATALERSLGVAEAMEARGYGGPGRTRAPERPPGRRDWALVAVGAAATGLVAAALAAGATGYRYYDTLGDPLQPEAIAGALALAALMAAAAGMVRWLR